MFSMPVDNTKILSLTDVVRKYCITKDDNDEDFYFGFNQRAYNEYLKHGNMCFYKFRFTKYNDDTINMWYCDVLLNIFKDKNKLEQFFKSLL